MKMAKATHEHIAEKLRPMAVPLSSLVPDPHNARKHDKRNLKAIADSLRENGQVKPIVVTDAGVVVAGNGTVQAAKSLGWTSLAVVVFRGTPEQARRFAIQDNRSAELAEWDDAELAKILAEIQSEGDDALASIGFSDEEFMKIMALAEGGESEFVGDIGESAGVSGVNIDNGGAGLPESTVRMVNLFLTDTTQPQLTDWARFLGTIYSTTNITDTVLEAVRREYMGHAGLE